MLTTRLLLRLNSFGLPLVGTIISGALLAGDPLLLNDENPALVSPTFESRARYGFASQDGLEDSHAGTWRNRIGLLSKEINGFQFFAEYEGTLAGHRSSYNDATGRRALNRTVIADPESHELNQLWGSYKDPDGLVLVKAGRQGIKLDNERYVGTVAWRQNMQTMDAATVTLNPTEDLEIYYGYVRRVNRIFGSEVIVPGRQDFTGNSHLINVKYDGLEVGKLTSYTYLLDLHNRAGDTNSSNTFGVSLDGSICDDNLSYYLEYAAQTGAFDNPLNYTSHYGHGYVGAPLFCDDIEGTLGLEYLGADNGVGFQSPLATLHKFNGYADRFLVTPATGLSDFYGKIEFELPHQIEASVWYHHFWDSHFDRSAGDEVDLVLSKDLGNGFTVLTKGAHFQGKNGQPNVNRATIQMGYKH